MIKVWDYIKEYDQLGKKSSKRLMMYLKMEH